MTIIPPWEKIIETKECRKCSQSFVVTDKDARFYDKMEVPHPQCCPHCRFVRKLAHCNEGVLYKNRCSGCEKSTISYVPSDDPRKVFCRDCFFNDSYDPLEYGQDIDWDRSIFEQLHELELRVPHLYTASSADSENSEYMHHAWVWKNCYLLFHADFNEDCYYGYGIKYSKDSVDNHYCHDSQWCYECIDVRKCNNMFWSQSCENCSDCYFCTDCRGCNDCFMSTNLRNQSFVFMNEQLSQTEYKKRKEEFNTWSYSLVKKAHALNDKLKWKMIKEALVTKNTEASFGNNLNNTKNAWECYDCSDIEDCKFVHQSQYDVKDCYDIYQYGINASHCYECDMLWVSVINCKFCHIAFENSHDLTYCIHARQGCSNCFASVSINKNHYCILNKQYSQQEYWELTRKLIQKMKSDGEYGEYFPIRYSESAYNETNAQYFEPLTKKEALDKWYRWRDDTWWVTWKETTDTIPDNIEDVDKDFLQEILKCSTCSNNYKIVPQELLFYRKNNLPIPRSCFDCRRRKRQALRPKRTMIKKACVKCDVVVQACHEKWNICCTKCYNDTIYNWAFKN